MLCFNVSRKNLKPILRLKYINLNLTVGSTGYITLSIKIYWKTGPHLTEYLVNTHKNINNIIKYRTSFLKIGLKVSINTDYDNYN